MIKNIILLILGIVLFLSCGQEQSSNSKPLQSSNPLFSLLSSDRTGINFQNKLIEGLNANILVYEYFYNGGGVSCADFNNDGLIDIYFTANMQENKLYLNQGNMLFMDATQLAGVGGRPGPWKTGVTYVDINADGLQDIYVCYSGALPAVKRENQLFVNQGNSEQGIPTFVDMAKEYGLASQGHSNQAYFFDYDKDNDLDMVLLNHNPKSLPVLNVATTKVFLKKDDPISGLRLYQQSNGKFEDVTTKANISGSGLSYGLGVGISDINDDGWPDFYVSNDYAVPDYLYINNGDGSFTDKIDEYVGHNSHFSMGNDVADINNDGLLDIISLDMLPGDNFRQKILMGPDNNTKFDLNVATGFHYQYMRNMLQLNNGNNTFSEIGQMAGISNTDWSWSALLADFDNNGWKDLHITNGYLRDYTNQDFINYMENFVERKGRLLREDILEIIENMPSSNVVNYIYSNNGNDGSFEKKTIEWGLNISSNSNGAAYADLDNDGDLDLVVNNINQDAFIYQNNAESIGKSHYLDIILNGPEGNSIGIGTKVKVYVDGLVQTIEQYPTRGYLSAVSPTLHFGLGNVSLIDSIHIVWPSEKHQKLIDIAVNQVLNIEESNGTPTSQNNTSSTSIFEEVVSSIDYTHTSINLNDFNRQPLMLSEFSHRGPCMIKGDVNGDGLEDVFIGGNEGQSSELFIQSPGFSFNSKSINAFKSDKDYIDSDSHLFDADGDGDLDLYVVSGGYHSMVDQDMMLEDRLYLNNGSGDFTRSFDALPKIYSSGGCIAISDINNDGFLDVFVGSRVVPGRYPEPPKSSILINDGSGKFVDATSTLSPDLNKYGMISDATWVDMDLDGIDELIVVGEWSPIAIFSMEDGELKNTTSVYMSDNLKGWWNQIGIGDFNKDGKPDFIIGNIGVNTQFNVSKDTPAALYFDDFDNNGSVDPILCHFIEGTSYPSATREELLRQLSSLRSKFTTHELYAKATLDDIFSKSQLTKASKYNVNIAETSCLLSQVNGTYQVVVLPKEVQYAPVHSILIMDYDEDGNLDAILCGNDIHMKLSIGKFDANYGMLLKGDGKGGFKYISQVQSGFNIKGDVRSSIQIGQNILFGKMDGKLEQYKISKREEELQ